MDIDTADCLSPRLRDKNGGGLLLNNSYLSSSLSFNQKRVGTHQPKAIFLGKEGEYPAFCKDDQSYFI